MALKRLDEEFDLKPGTQLLPYMKRLLPSLEARFQSVEATAKEYADLIEYIRAAAILRMNEILIPATEDIIEVTTLGFLLGPSSTVVRGELGIKYFFVDEGPQRNTFTPSPYVIIERKANHDDYGIARVLQYSQETGQLDLEITAWHGNPGPHSDWVISSTPGMADSTKIYHDAVGPMHDQVVTDTAQVRIMRDEILAAAEALEGAGIDVYNYVRRDGTIPFTALQQGVNPPPGASDTNFATTSWVRARVIEYSGNSVNRTGDTMTGALTLAGAPINPLHAATKAYVDAIIGAGGIVNGPLTIATVQPTLRLRSTGPGQHRMIEAQAPNQTPRFILSLADTSPESGGEVGSNFVLLRYNDGGAYIDTVMTILRQTGQAIFKHITANGGIQSNGNTTTAGDMYVYRPGAPNTGVIYMNAAASAYHYYDGTNHQLTGGGLSVGHINCLSIYTQGHPITTWGLTSHGAITANASLLVNGTITLASGAPTITFVDSDYGNMFLHTNQGLIGWLGTQGNWLNYTNINGQMWTAAYGWMHDYINQQASAYAWSAADYRYNQVISSTRWVYAGDIDMTWYNHQLGEIANCEVTGLFCSGIYYGGVYAARWRQLQVMIAGGWYVSGWIS